MKLEEHTFQDKAGEDTRLEDMKHYNLIIPTADLVEQLFLHWNW